MGKLVVLAALGLACVSLGFTESVMAKPRGSGWWPVCPRGSYWCSFCECCLDNELKCPGVNVVPKKTPTKKSTN
jgi:hypothetical protein